MRLNNLVAALVALLASALPAHAQTQSDKLIPISLLSAESVARMAVESADTTESTFPPAVTVKASPMVTKAESGGKTLALLQAGMVALQAMDVVSTRQALNRPGAYEANGAMSNGLGTTVAIKAAATASIIVLTNRIAKTNRVAAVVTMVALNSAYATIAAHNLAIAHGR